MKLRRVLTLAAAVIFAACVAQALAQGLPQPGQKTPVPKVTSLPKTAYPGGTLKTLKPCHEYTNFAVQFPGASNAGAGAGAQESCPTDRCKVVVNPAAQGKTIFSKGPPQTPFNCVKK